MCRQLQSSQTILWVTIASLLNLDKIDGHKKKTIQANISDNMMQNLNKILMEQNQYKHSKIIYTMIGGLILEGQKGFFKYL